ncbi:MAG TPA: RNA polymerase sigma factor [Gemmata sp.]|nr:RNA polymerase sigma factor [Gemmata sp.]
MNESPFDSDAMKSCIDGWQEGDRAAANELFRSTLDRLQNLAHRMCRSFPNVRTLADTDDVLQNSIMRLLRSLRKMRPSNVRSFFNLAAVHIRRELLDLARRCRGVKTVSLDVTDSSNPHTRQLAAPDETGPETDLWVEFHVAVDHLPLDEREIVGLKFYHGWTFKDIAELFQLDERTIRRRWKSICGGFREPLRAFLEE